jgi:hypothetical protein
MNPEPRPFPAKNGATLFEETDAYTGITFYIMGTAVSPMVIVQTRSTESTTYGGNCTLAELRGELRPDRSLDRRPQLLLAAMRMTLEEFRAALVRADPPAGLNAPLRALWLDGKGDWDTAHETVDDPDIADGARVHAYLHREEGTSPNARYWVRGDRPAEPRQGPQGRGRSRGGVDVAPHYRAEMYRFPDSQRDAHPTGCRRMLEDERR